MGSLAERTSASAATGQPRESGAAALDFAVVYEANFTFVWRAARRLGVQPADTDDVVQEVFVVAHRKLGSFEGRAQVKTWLFKILLHVVRHYQRTQQRKPAHRPTAGADLDGLLDLNALGPGEAAERAEAVRLLDGLLGQLDADKREVFVLAEIEQMSCVEIADVLAANLNTVYSRLRAARQEFERAVARLQTHAPGVAP
jgi:RNA polymerase sigma-70 factor, ECF subfamily